MPRVVAVPSTRRQPSAVRRSVRSTTPTWLPQKPAITVGTPLIVPRATSTPGQVGEARVREDEVRVAGEDGVDPRHLGEIGGGVLVHAARRRGGQPGVDQRHDEIRPGRAHLGHVAARRLDDVDHEHPVRRDWRGPTA